MRSLLWVMMLALVMGISCSQKVNKNPSTLKKATAKISSTDAKFWFPITKKDSWKWGTTAHSSLEYGWTVEFPTEDGMCEAGFTYWNFPGQGSGSGTLVRILASGQTNFWMNHSNVPRAFGIRSSYHNEGVLIKITEPKFLLSLLKEKPESITFFQKGALQENREFKVVAEYE